MFNKPRCQAIYFPAIVVNQHCDNPTPSVRRPLTISSPWWHTYTRPDIAEPWLQWDASGAQRLAGIHSEGEMPWRAISVVKEMPNFRKTKLQFVREHFGLNAFNRVRHWCLNEDLYLSIMWRLYASPFNPEVIFCPRFPDRQVQFYWPRFWIHGCYKVTSCLRNGSICTNF